MNPRDRQLLWLRWVAANGLGEMFGLGLTFALGVSLISLLGDGGGVAVIIGAFLIAVASGAIEATLVGSAQWWAMRSWFPRITHRAWWLATLIGALLAYILGYLPSTLMSLGEEASPSQVAVAEPAQWIVLMLAGGLGLAGGAVLSFAQWLSLRKSVRGAGLWVPANMLAWFIGMPLIFWGIDFSQRFDRMTSIVLFMAGVLLLTGVLVGAIHGAFLVKLASPEKSRNV